MTLTFAHLYIIVAGFITSILVLLYLRLAVGKRRQALAQFAHPDISKLLTANVSHTRRRIKDTLLLVAIFCCFLALARPQYGDNWIEVKQKGIDILIAVDTSRSMLARDILPNRLQRAKLAIRDFVGQLDGDRVGLMPFAGSSYLMCPLTTDYSAFLSSLDAIDANTIPIGGTDLAGVISSADSLLEGEANHKILVLVTDGEDLEGTALEAAEKAAQAKMTIYTVGVGTAKGELIPDLQGGRGTFVKDDSGNIVRSRLDETTLTHIAEKTGGLYVPLGNTGQGFTTIYQQKLELVPKQEHHERMERRPIERFYWPIAAALLLLAMEFLISGRKPTRHFGLPLIKSTGRRIFKRKELLIVLLFFTGILPVDANGSTADELYLQGDYQQAEQEYTKELHQDPENTRLQFNLGDSQYKNKAYEKAVDSYEQALQSDDLGLQAKTYYNLGNARYQLGKTALKSDPTPAMELYRKAIEAYEGGLALNPDDKNASFNRDLVKKQLEELEKQQQEQQQGQDKQDQEKEDKKEQQKQSGQDSDQQEGKKQQEDDKASQSQDEQQGDKQSDSKEEQNKSPKKQSTGDEEKDRNNGKKSTKPEEESQPESQTGQQEEHPRQSEGEPAQKSTGGSAADMSKADQERRQQGKMTLQEARDLLDALENEEGRLNVIPQRRDGTNNTPSRNW